MPRVSVIIPTHNRSEFLRVAITSVLNQTFQDFEIIIVDDASKDDTHKVVSSLNDERIKYIRHELNKGVSAARNTGLSASSCNYIAFLDDDDEWLPVKLEMQINLLEKSPSKVGAVYTGYEVIDRASGQVLGQRVPTKRGNIFNDMLIDNPIGNTSIALCRKECFDKVGLFNAETVPFEDYEMWIRISKEFHFECIREILVKYYIHDRDQLSSNKEASLKSIEIMLKKYGQSSTLRKYFSNHYLSLGVVYCYHGNTKKGREVFFKAIRLYPFEIRHYFNLCLSVLGADYFKRLKNIKDKLVTF